MGKIVDLVSDSALGQLDTLLIKLGANTQAMIDATAAANKFNNEIGNVKTLTDFTTASQEAIKAMIGVSEANKTVIESQKQIQIETQKVTEIVKAKIEAEALMQKSTVTYSETLNQAIAKQITLQSELKKTTADIAVFTANSNLSEAALKKVTTAAGLQGVSLDGLRQKQALLRGEIQQNNVVLNQQVKENLAASGSYNEMSARLDGLRNKFKTLSAEQAQNTEIGGKMTTEIKQLSNALKEQDAQMGVNNRNVGNYGSAFSGLNSVLSSFGIFLGGMQLVQWGKDLFGVAKEAAGVDSAFSRLGRPDLIPKLREQTRGLIDDLDLEKAAVKINNFGISLENVGTILAFATQRAEDTGKSVDEVVQKIADGLGKGTRSVSALAAALGINVSELREALKRTGDLADAVTLVVNKDMDDMGVHVDTLTDKTNKLSAFFSNLWKNASAFVFSDPEDAAMGTVERLIQADKERLNISKMTDTQVQAALKSQINLIKQISDAKIANDRSLTMENISPDFDYKRVTQVAKNSNEKLLAAQAILKLLKDQNNALKDQSDKEASILGMQEKVAKIKQEANTMDVGVIGGDGKIHTEADRQKLLQEAKDLQSKIDAILGKPEKKTKQEKDYDKALREKLENERISIEDRKKLALIDLNNDKNTYQQKLDALASYQKASYELIANEEQTANLERDISPIKKNTNAKRANSQRDDVKVFGEDQTKRASEQLAAQLRKNLEDILATDKGIAEQAIADLQQTSDRQIQILDIQRSKEETILVDKYKKGEIKEKEYRAQLLAINDQYNVDRLGQIAFFEQAKLEVLQAKKTTDINDATKKGATPAEITKITNSDDSAINSQQNKVDSAGVALTNASNTQTTNSIKGTNQESEKQKELDQAGKQADQLVAIGKNYNDKLTQAAEERYKRLGELQSEQIEIERARVEAGVGNERQKSQALALIAAKDAAQKKTLIDEENKLKRKQAIDDKIAAEASIVINTAVAATKAAAQTGIGFLATTPAIIAFGAIQAAAIAAAPIAYEHGGTVPKDAIIQTGEAGTELRIDPTGKYSFTHDKPNLTYAKKGTQIISNKELIAMMGKPEQINYVGGQAIDMNKMVEAQRETTKAIKGLQQQSRPKGVSSSHSQEYLKRIGVN